jgi:hypothetical protein
VSTPRAEVLWAKNFIYLYIPYNKTKLKIYIKSCFSISPVILVDAGEIKKGGTT